MAPLAEPVGSLLGVPRPEHPVQALGNYVGLYANDDYGPLQVLDSGGRLELRLGPGPTVFPLTDWDGDVFTFELDNENAPPGSMSKASCHPDRVVLEYYDDDGLGTFVR